MSALLKAAEQAAHSLRMFKAIAKQAEDRGDRIDLAPAELWESQDEARLEALELAIRIEKGERPLMEV